MAVGVSRVAVGVSHRVAVGMSHRVAVGMSPVWQWVCPPVWQWACPPVWQWACPPPGIAAPLKEGLDGTAVAVGRGQVLPEDSQPLVGLVDELSYVVGRGTRGIPCHATSSTHHYTEREWEL